jgi:hypothetical protein
MADKVAAEKERREKLYGSNVGGASPVCGDIQT